MTRTSPRIARGNQSLARPGLRSPRHLPGQRQLRSASGTSRGRGDATMTSPRTSPRIPVRSPGVRRARASMPANRPSWPASWTAGRTCTPGRARAQLRRDDDPPPRPARPRGLAHRHRRRDLAELRSFANGIHRDQQAATNGLTCPAAWPAVEGNVTKIKMLKRQLQAALASPCYANASSFSPGNDDHGIGARAFNRLQSPEYGPDPALDPRATPGGSLHMQRVQRGLQRGGVGLAGVGGAGDRVRSWCSGL